MELKEEFEASGTEILPDQPNRSKPQTSNLKPETYVSECQIDTDLELLFPESYIENMTERIHLYRALDNIENEEKLTEFERELVDRFGPIPEPSRELINVIRLRRLAASLGFEKIMLRNERLLVYFVSNPKSPYYESATFGRILQHVQQKPRLFRMKEAKDKLAMSVSPVRSIGECMKILEKFVG